MTRSENVYWFGSYFHVLVMIGFLVIIWRTKSYTGISLRSQILYASYALVFTTRHQDLQMFYLPVESSILKILYLVVTYGTVLSMLIYFSKTYEKQNDRTRINIWIGSCLILSLLMNHYFEFLCVISAFSIYFEAIAMIPQFQLIIRTKRIDKNVVLYLAAMAAYSVLYVANSCRDFGRGPRIGNVRTAAAALQLLLYIDFFYRIYPWLNFNDDDNQRTKFNCGRFSKMFSLLYSQKPEDVESDVEKEDLAKGHLASNVGNVVLTPFALTGIQNEKESPDKKEAIKN